MAAHNSLNVLSTELAHFAANKKRWLKTNHLQFALIHKDQKAGFFQTYEDAYKSGSERFGPTEPFLIKQIIEQEPVFVMY